MQAIRSVRGIGLGVGLVCALAGCKPDQDGEDSKYRATIERTSHGIAHITADDLGSLAYGQGYAFSEDHVCDLLDQIVKVRSERAKYHGPGQGDRNIITDFAILHQGILASAERDYEELSDDSRELIEGYVAGVNAYIDEVGVDGVQSTCAGAPWVGPITETELFAYVLDLGTLASGRQLHDFMVAAVPPGGGDGGEFPLSAPGFEDLGRIRDTPLGSNGWGIGSELSATGGGMVMGNPHFPWEGELRLWESHLTIPGEMDVYGVSLLGAPGILIGFNEAVGWTHTVSAGQRFNLYQVTLDPDDPTRYLYDGESREMEKETYTIAVKNDDGSMREESKTLYRSHYGPMLSLAPFEWSANLGFALTYRDANIDNRVLLDQFLGMNRAESLEDFQEAHATYQGIPWVNTISASADGRAWYTDSTPTPNLSDEAVAAWEQRIADSDFVTAAVFELAGLYVFDGSNPRDEWVEAGDARDPGLVPFADMPQLERADYVFNANDSHWLSNLSEPLEGYHRLHGEERTPRRPRTRMNARILTEGADGYAGEDGKFDLEELEAAALGNRSFMAELLRDQVVERCMATNSVMVGGEAVDVTQACSVLADWDTMFNTDSVGAVVWRELLGDYDLSSSLASTTSPAFFDAGSLFETPFDPNDPLETPNTLTPADGGVDRVLVALASAVQLLDQAGIALDAPLGDVQFTRKGKTEIPIHGGNRNEGITNLITYSAGLHSATFERMSRGELLNSATQLSEDGYLVNYGTSFIMSVAFGDDGPQAEAFLTYSQSGEPSSEYYSDQTELFSDKQWRACLFSREEIEADPEYRSYVVSASP